MRGTGEDRSPAAPCSPHLLRHFAERMLMTASRPKRDSDVFHREGEYWTIAYQGTLFRLRDAKGLRYLAHLLQHPGRHFAAAELATVDCGLRNADCRLDGGRDC